MNRIMSMLLCMALAISLLMTPVRALAKGVNNNIDTGVSTEVIIEDEETPLYSGTNGLNTYGAYTILVGVGTLLIFGTVAFVEKEKHTI